MSDDSDASTQPPQQKSRQKKHYPLLTVAALGEAYHRHTEEPCILTLTHLRMNYYNKFVFFMFDVINSHHTPTLVAALQRYFHADCLVIARYRTKENTVPSAITRMGFYSYFELHGHRDVAASAENVQVLLPDCFHRLGRLEDIARWQSDDESLTIAKAPFTFSGTLVVRLPIKKQVLASLPAGHEVKNMSAEQQQLLYTLLSELDIIKTPPTFSHSRSRCLREAPLTETMDGISADLPRSRKTASTKASKANNNKQVHDEDVTFSVFTFPVELLGHVLFYFDNSSQPQQSHQQQDGGSSSSSSSGQQVRRVEFNYYDRIAP